MKCLFVLFVILVCTICRADTFNINWYVDDNNYAQTTCSTGGDINLPASPNKYGYDFIGWEKIHYVTVEYLESNGTQYIDTGIKATGNITVKFKMKLLGFGSFFGARYVGNNITEEALWLAAVENRTLFLYNNLITFNQLPKWTLRTEYNVEIVNGFLNVNNTLLATYNPETFEGENMTLFKASDYGGPDTTPIASIDLYYFQLWDNNNTLVRDMIPVLDEDGVPCMYDKVSGQFFYNQGTGQFIAGPIIQ